MSDHKKNLRTSQSKFSLDVFYMGITKIFLIILKIGMSVITARFLGPAGRGIFYSFFQASGMTNTIFTISIGEGLIYNIGRGKIKREDTFGTVISLAIFFGTLVAGVLFLILPLIQEYLLQNISSDSLMLAYLIAPAIMYEYFANSALRGLKIFSIANKISITSRITVLISSCLALYIYDGSLYHLFLWYWFGLLVNCLIYSFALFQASRFKFFFNVSSIPSTVRYSLRVHPAVLLTELEYRLDIFILLFFLEPAAVGIYSIGVTAAQLVWYASNSVNSIFFPYLSSMEKSKSKNHFSAKVIRFNLLINFLLVLMLCIFGSFLIDFLYGYEFSESYFVLLILAPGLLVDSIGRNLVAWLKAEGAPKILSIISITSLVINIILNFILIPNFGLYGAALSSVITYSFKALALLVVFQGLTNLSFKQIFFWSKTDYEYIGLIFKSVFKKNN